MAENNEKFSLDDILNEYTPKKTDSSGVSVDDIIFEVKKSADTPKEEMTDENITAEDQADIYEQAEAFDETEDEPENEPEQITELQGDLPEEKPDLKLSSLGGMFERLREEELDRAIADEEEQISQSDVDDDFDEKAAETDSVKNDKDFTYRPREHSRGAAFTMRTDDDSDERKIPTSQSEYTKRGEESKILGQILRLKNTLTVRAAVLLFASVFSSFITLANDLSLPLSAVFDRTVNASAYLFTNTILGIIVVGFSYSVITMGLKAIFNRRPDSDSIAAVNILVAIIAGLVTLFDPESLKASFFHLYTSTAILGMLFNTLGKLSIVRRTQRNFEFVSESPSFAAVSLVDDDSTVAYLTNGSAGRKKELATLKRTGFIKDFMKNSYSSDLSDLYAEKTAPFILAVSLIIGLLSIVFEKNSASSAEKLFVFLASVSGTLSLCTSFALTLIVNVPLSRASKKLVDYSGVMLGYSSVEEFSEVNSVMIDSGHLFPTGTVEFVNLKMLGSVLIDKGIIYAASLASAGKSITQPAFYKMLRGNLDMLMPVKGCVCEDNLGISGWIDSERVLLGGREIMEKQGITGLPGENSEEAFANGNCVMYLAVGGKAAMMFAVSLSVGAAAERWVQELEDESIDIHVRCSDGFLTRELLANMFDISPSTIRLLPSNCDSDCERITEPCESISASMFCSGHLPTFSMLIIAAKRVKFSANIGVAVQYSAMILGILIAAIMMITGAFSQITPTIVTVYNLTFLLLTYLLQSTKKV